MGKEYRIGIVAGLLMLVVGIGVVLMNQGSDKKPPVEPVTPTEPGVTILGTSTDPVGGSTDPTGFDPTFAPVGGVDPVGTAPVAGVDPVGTIDPTAGVVDPVGTTDPTAGIAATTPPAGATSPSDPTFFDPNNVDPNAAAITAPVTDPTAGVTAPVTDPTAGVTTTDPTVAPIAPRPGDFDFGPPTLPVAPVTSTPKTHVVKSGDSYWSLAEKYLGHGKYHLRIKDANPGVNSNNLRLGTVLKIPAKPVASISTTTTAPTTAGIATTAADGTKRYTVAKGDTMGGIAQKLYGSVRYTHLIQKANPSVDPKRMRLGKVLRIPPRPVASTRPTTTRPTTSRPTTSRPATTVRRNPDEPWFGNGG